MKPQDPAQFATLLTQLIDPRTEAEEVVPLISALDNDDTLIDAMVCLASLLSGYIDGEITRIGADVEEYMDRTHTHMLANITQVEDLVHEGGLFL